DLLGPSAPTRRRARAWRPPGRGRAVLGHRELLSGPALRGAQERRAVGSFSVRGAGGIPAEPDRWLPAPLLADPGVATTVAAPPLFLASASSPLLLDRGCP